MNPRLLLGLVAACLPACGASADGAATGVESLTQSTTRPMTIVTVGGSHACALAFDGQAWCWGRNDSGELGNANPIPTPSYTPTGVLALP